MKTRILYIIGVCFCVSVFTVGCKSSKEVVEETPPPPPRSSTRIVDDNFILLNDAFSLTNGMTYTEVKTLLKQDPYQIYSNIEDNCIILKYKGKKQLRKHISDGESPVPMEFYPSNSTKFLTYGEPFELFVILDGRDKKVRSYFMNGSVSRAMESINMLNRAKLVCDRPQDIENMMLEWYFK